MRNVATKWARLRFGCTMMESSRFLAMKSLLMVSSKSMGVVRDPQTSAFPIQIGAGGTVVQIRAVCAHSGTFFRTTLASSGSRATPMIDLLYTWTGAHRTDLTFARQMSQCTHSARRSEKSRADIGCPTCTGEISRRCNQSHTKRSGPTCMCNFFKADCGARVTPERLTNRACRHGASTAPMALATCRAPSHRPLGRGPHLRAPDPLAVHTTRLLGAGRSCSGAFFK